MILLKAMMYILLIIICIYNSIFRLLLYAYKLYNTNNMFAI